MPINYRDYHPKWSLISRLIRFNRAQNKCEKCEAVNGQPHPVTGSKVVLTVAHVDQDRRNNRFWNLRAWCQRCHLGHDRKTHIYNRKYGRETKYVNGKLFDMKITIENTTKIVELNGVPARVWEGTTEAGVKMHAFITRVAVANSEDPAVHDLFRQELHEMKAPSADVQAIPLRLIL